MDNAKTIWEYLIERIKNPYGVAGLMGNLYAESCLNPENLQNGYENRLHMTDAQYTAAVDDGTYKDFDSDQAGYGLAQWTYSARKHNLLVYAKSRGQSIGNLEMQLGFLWQELQGYSAVLKTLETATSVRQASDAVLTQYERPADQSDAMKKRRAEFGQVYYDRFAAQKQEAFHATGAGLAAFAEAVFKAEWVYWYGTCGYRCTESLYKSKKAQYPSEYTAAREADYQKDIQAGKMCADCVGLIKAYFWMSGNPNGENVYKANNCPDKSANGMFSTCTERGHISTIPDIPGIVVHKDGHIGVYVGGGYTVEMMGFAYDCRRKKVTDGKWKEWGKLPPAMISYDEAPAAQPSEPTVPANPQKEPLWSYPGLLKRGAKGEAVKRLQSALNRLGFDAGEVDGDYGPKTEAAVKRLQKAAGIEVDGDFGRQSYAALKSRWEAAQK